MCKHRPFIAWTDRVQWQSNPDLQAWQEAKRDTRSSMPLCVSLTALAGCSNRLRMITASFLVKDFYRSTGAKASVFHVQLIDGDLAANNGGWQWAASNRTDAAPNSYFQPDNPGREI
ncbi:FAD-binding domain-containing protein [Shigella boydii]